MYTHLLVGPGTYCIFHFVGRHLSQTELDKFLRVFERCHQVLGAFRALGTQQRHLPI